MERKELKAAVTLVACLGLAFCASAQKKAARAQEKDPQYQYSVGASYLQLNKVDEALKYFERSLALNPRYFLAWNAVGLSRSMKSDLKGAAQAYEKCLEINPKFTEAHNNLGMIYQEMGFPDRAEGEFRKAIEDPSYSSRELPYYNMAGLYFTMNRIEDAYDEIRRALEIRPRFPLALNRMGQILERQEDLVAAISAYEQAVKLVPDDPIFGFNLGAALFKNNELERAKEVLERISPRVTDPGTKAKLREYLDTIKGKSSPPA